MYKLGTLLFTLALFLFMLSDYLVSTEVYY